MYIVQATDFKLINYVISHRNFYIEMHDQGLHAIGYRCVQKCYKLNVIGET